MRVKVGSLVRHLSYDPMLESVVAKVGIIEKLYTKIQGQGHTYIYWVVNFGNRKLKIDEYELEVICK